ncbi:magnesium transporter MRS2-G isoform X1 [Canna indica]|uniref:Magnesium transporter n=1 Tax=Canna indica TaxID=4628 RepID=A0AAQ3KI25_9LILI|nr:magnesium transporter MRS2-G isoform X1 [Canna indica]
MSSQHPLSTSAPFRPHVMSIETTSGFGVRRASGEGRRAPGDAKDPSSLIPSPSSDRITATKEAPEEWGIRCYRDRMGRRSGKKSFSLFSKRTRSVKRLELQPVLFPLPNHLVARHNGNLASAADGLGPGATSAAIHPHGGKGAKKKAGMRLWMRFDRAGESEVLELDRNAIIRRVGIPPRDLRILGPIFSHSSNILAREKAMVVNLEFIKAIVTAEEVLILDPLCQEVLPFVDQLRQLLHSKSPFRVHAHSNNDKQIKDKFAAGEEWTKANEAAESEHELPFEFQALEVALEIVCTHFECKVADLEKDAYPVLDELARNVSTKNLERVRSLKSILTRLLARLQKVRDEIEHLLDDNEDMTHLYLTRKQIQNQQYEAFIASGASNSIVPAGPCLSRVGSNFNGSASIISSIYVDDNDVEDLEMLLEAYFIQLDGMRNKILSVREYIDDTEDYLNIQLDNQRNELIQLQLVLSIASFGIVVDTYIVGAFAMNIPCELYEIPHIFTPFVLGTSGGCFLIFLLMLAYARWKKLLGP